MTALEPPAFQDRPALGGTRAAPEAVYAHPASFFRLIGTFRHKHTSLFPRIIGVPKFGVKETLDGLALSLLNFECIAYRSRRIRGNPETLSS